MNSRQKRKQEAETHNREYAESKLPPQPKTNEEMAKDRKRRRNVGLFTSMAIGLSMGNMLKMPEEK